MWVAKSHSVSDRTLSINGHNVQNMGLLGLRICEDFVFNLKSI